MSPGLMENVALPDSSRARSFQAINSKKRARLEMSSQTPAIADRVKDTPKHSEVFMLKEALKSERDTLRKLHIELKEERGASMTAANEAMAMITRLQEEKAAVLMEARRYRRVAEEKETYNQEAISVLKDALLTKEDDLLALQDLLNAYRETFLRLEAERQGDHGNYLEGGRDDDQLLLLEGANAGPSLCRESNYIKYYGQKQFLTSGASIWRTVDEQKDFDCQDELLGLEHNQLRHDDPSRNFTGWTSDHHAGVCEEKRYEDTSEEDHFTGKGQAGNFGGFNLQDTYCERKMFPGHKDHNSEIGNDEQSQEQCLDDVSVSIFARVKRLEERFEYLRQNQALERQSLNVACQADGMFLNDLEREQITRADWDSAPEVLSNGELRHCMESERLMEDPVNGGSGEPEEVLKCLSFERDTMDMRNEVQKHCFLSPQQGAGQARECRESRTNLQRVDKTSFADINDDGGEGVHDVYEVQYEIKRPFVHPPEQDHRLDNNGEHKCEIGNMDTLPLPSNQVQPEVRSAVDDKLSVKVSLLDVKDVQANVADEDVRELKVRLQALEGERSFMKEAIESLRNENKELKVLQEIAQQLRELKSDVRRTEAPEQQDQLPVFSFFKGLLSLTGLQNLAATAEGSRSFLRSSSGFSKREQGGLHHILNKDPKTQSSVCVTREHKVIFNST